MPSKSQKTKALTKAPMPLKSAASRLFDQPGPRQISSLLIHFARCHLASETVTEGGVATSTMAIWTTVFWSFEKEALKTQDEFLVKFRWICSSLMIAFHCQLAFWSGLRGWRPGGINRNHHSRCCHVKDNAKLAWVAGMASLRKHKTGTWLIKLDFWDTSIQPSSTMH